MSPDLQVLIDLFYPTTAQLGTFSEVEAHELPDAERRLLAHDEHMTESMELFHHSPVNVHVLQTAKTLTHYARKILLTRSSDDRVVQFGLVRLNRVFLGDQVLQEIESESVPLGRILIRNNVLRTVRLLSLWRIVPGEDLCRLFSIDHSTYCYGRTAFIYCNGIPAVELLEIVTPSESVVTMPLPSR